MCQNVIFFKNCHTNSHAEILSSVIDIVGKIKLLSWHIFWVYIWIKIFDFLQTLVVCSVGETTVTDPGFVVKGLKRPGVWGPHWASTLVQGKALVEGGGGKWRSHQKFPGTERILKHPFGYSSYTWHSIRSMSNNKKLIYCSVLKRHEKGGGAFSKSKQLSLRHC